MTENQRQEMLRDIKDGYIDAWDNLAIDELFKEIEKEHKEVQKVKEQNETLRALYEDAKKRGK